MEQIKETLYSVNKKGKAIQWSCFVEGSSYFMEYGQVGGKLQTKETKCKSKNVGKSNETTPEQQALNEAEARWTKQWNREGYRHTVEDGEKAKQDFCMLAADGRKHPHYAKYPAHSQPKLDGVRAFNCWKGDEVIAYSRELVVYDVHDELKEEIKDLMARHGYDRLDGEFYIHGMALQDINSAVKSKDNEDHKNVCFYVFDVPYKNLNWLNRSVDLTFLINDQKKYKYIKFVPFEEVSDELHLEEIIEKYEEDGYEGAMVRNFDGLYEFGFRSNDLIKFKNMQESEAKVVGCTEDKNGEGVLLCEWNRSITFEMKMMGTHEERVFEQQEKLVGEWVTFIYQDTTKDGKPTFARGKCVRQCDEDGKPLV